MMSLSIEATYSRNSGASAIDQVHERIAHSLRNFLADPRLAATGGQDHRCLLHPPYSDLHYAVEMHTKNTLRDRHTMVLRA